jgi:hypothetical protein
MDVGTHELALQSVVAIVAVAQTTVAVPWTAGKL